MNPAGEKCCWQLMWKFSKNHRNHPLHHIDNVQPFKHVGRIHHDMFNVQECGPISLPALSSLHSHNQSRSPCTMMRGVMWIHRDRYFSRWVSSWTLLLLAACITADFLSEIIAHLINIFRWKERFVVVTRDYLQCYKRVVTEASQMGPFLNQVFTNGLILPYLVGFCSEKNGLVMSQLQSPQTDGRGRGTLVIAIKIFFWLNDAHLPFTFFM